MKVFDLLLTVVLVAQFAFGWLPIASAATTQATKVNRVLGDDLTAFINSDHQITLTDRSHKTGQSKEILRGIVLDVLMDKSGTVLTKCFLTGGEQLNVLSRGKREAKTIIKLKDGTTTIGKVSTCTGKTLTLLSESGDRREILWSDVSRVISPYLCTISGAAGKSSPSTLQYAVKTIVTADGAFYKAADIQISYRQPTTIIPWLDLKSSPEGVFGAVFDLAPDSDKAPVPSKTTFDPRSLTTFDCSNTNAFRQQADVFRMQMSVPQQLAYAGCAAIAYGTDSKDPKTTDPITAYQVEFNFTSHTGILITIANPGAGDKRKPDDGGKSDTGNKPDAGRQPDPIPPEVTCDSQAVRFQLTSPLLLTTVPIDPVPPPPENVPSLPPPPRLPPPPPPRRGGGDAGWDMWPGFYTVEPYTGSKTPRTKPPKEVELPKPKPPLQDSALPDPKGGVPPVVPVDPVPHLEPVEPTPVPTKPEITDPGPIPTGQSPEGGPGSKDWVSDPTPLRSNSPFISTATKLKNPKPSPPNTLLPPGPPGLPGTDPVPLPVVETGDKIAMATPGTTITPTTVTALEEAQKSGLCEVELSCDSNPLECAMKVKNLSAVSQTLNLPAFTCFLSPDAAANQNMMKGSDPTFSVGAGQSISVSIDTYCVSTKSIKTPPKDGLKYRLGPYPDKEVHKQLVHLIETANRLNQADVYDAVPLKAEMRPRKVAQTAIWMYLGKRSGKKSEYITVASLKDDLLNSGQGSTQKLSPEQLKRVELFAQLIFTAAEKTVKEASTGK